MVTFNIFLVVILVVSFLLISVILVQKPKGTGLSSTFGGSTQFIGGVKKTGDFLDRTTWTLGTLLIVFVLLANVVLKNSDVSVGGDSILESQKTEIPAPQQ